MFSFNKHVFFSALTVILLAILVCFRFFGEIILHPDEFLFGPTGDGLKNYFTVAYQVIHGEGYWFNGMLYPYGDHLMYADGQPLLTKVLSWFIDPEVNNGGQVVGAINLLLIGSLVVTAWCIHRLLVWNQVNPWFAVPFALTIGFLSPQMARFTGHYALAYTFIVPVFWLLVESINRYKFPWIMAVVSTSLVLLAGYLHPYYLFIFVIFLGFILGWELLLAKFQLRNVKNWAARGFALIAPLILFMAFQKLADPITDRPASPSGIFEYVASFQSVFVPVAEPFRSLFNSYFFRIFIPSSWEGEAYIGFVAAFTAFVSVVLIFKRFIKRRWKVFTHPVLPNALRPAFVPGILTLLFSMGLFHYLGLNWLSEFISPLKQFRSLGRVAWIFYYVFSVWTVYYLYKLFRHFRSVNKGTYTYHISIIIVLCAFVWMLDAIVNIKFNKAQMLNKVALESFSDQYANQWRDAGVGLDDYQAIIPLPLMLVGSEKISLENGRESMVHSMRGAFSTGIPIVGGAMSRTSLEVAEKTAQLVANAVFPAPILDEFNPDKKLLLLRSNEALNSDEFRLAEAAKLVFTHSDYQLYSISVNELRKFRSPMVYIPDSLEKSLEDPYVTLKGHNENSENLWGAKCYDIQPSNPILGADHHFSEPILLSYWVKVNPEDEGLPNTVLTSADGQKLERRIDLSPNLLDGWLLVSDTLDFPNKEFDYSLQSRSGIISRVMLRKVGEDILHEEDGNTFFNNIPIR